MKIDALRWKKSETSGQVEDRVAESGRFDPCLLANEQMGVQTVEEQGHAVAFDQVTSELLSEHRNVLDHMTGLQEPRDKENQEIRAKTAARALKSLKETFEVVSLVPLQQQVLTDN